MMYSSTLWKPRLPLKILHIANSLVKRTLVDAMPLNSSFLLSKVALLDYERTLNNLEDVERNFAIRRRVSEIDLHALKGLYSILEKHKMYRQNLKKATSESEDQELMAEMKYSCESVNAAIDCREQYSTDQMTLFLKYYNRFQAVFHYFYLKLPNELHERTPTGDENTIVYSKLSSNGETDVDDHLVVGKRLGVLHYVNASAYYLLKDAVLLEMAITRFLTDVFQNELKFTPFRNPDTCHDFVLQGMIGDDLYDNAFLLEDSQYWLTGGASFSAFCAFRMCTSVNGKFLPERSFVCGRRYVPPRSLEENGLYTACQRTNLHFSVAANSSDQMMAEFDSILDRLRSLYEQLALDFRICYIPAEQLNPAESCRASIQLHSIRNNDFVEIAHVSAYNDFISRRLRMLYHNKNSEYFFLHIIEGCAMSVPTLVACLLEHSNDKMLIPECIRPYMYNQR